MLPGADAGLIGGGMQTWGIVRSSKASGSFLKKRTKNLCTAVAG
jgi:hypothetical protein